jgi:hypothetical protein
MAISGSKLNISQLGQRWHPRSDVKLLPAKYELTEPSDLVVCSTRVKPSLLTLLEWHFIVYPNQLHEHARDKHQIPVFNYLQRLATHAKLPSAILLSMVYYIDRLCMGIWGAVRE